MPQEQKNWREQIKSLRSQTTQAPQPTYTAPAPLTPHELGHILLPHFPEGAFQNNPVRLEFAKNCLHLAKDTDVPCAGATLQEQDLYINFLRYSLISKEMRKCMDTSEFPDAFPALLVKLLPEFAEKNLASCPPQTPGYSFMLTHTETGTPVLTEKVAANTLAFAKTCIDYLWRDHAIENPPSGEARFSQLFTQALAAEIDKIPYRWKR